MERAPCASKLRSIVDAALIEDCVDRDVTTLAVVPAEAVAKASIIARDEGVLAGTAVAEMVFRQCDSTLESTWLAEDGEAVSVGQEVWMGIGSARSLLAAERTALNFLQQLSGVATMTAQLTALVPGIAIHDTRKTIPGLRDLQKAAVVAGGGKNQRRDLADEVLLKENHFALSGHTYAETVALARVENPDLVLGCEAQTEQEAEWALRQGADYILLDNFPLLELGEVARRLRDQFPQAQLEASGGLSASNLGQLVDTGVDRVSVGALTHSVAALDLSFYLNSQDASA
ncbi:MAG: carboxylating nicotinate-nucleotide diphosphorylase [Planctomycetes bacterium]|nr:carboxylating nicotinate-nucleotide diphosphorylase [Planctomycetota bacterium]